MRENGLTQGEENEKEEKRLLFINEEDKRNNAFRGTFTDAEF